MELQDDVLQLQHQLLFGDGDTVVELALTAKGLAPSQNRAVMATLAVMGSLTAAEQTARLLYEHWGASTSATLIIAGRADVVGEN
ncbi:hypothetical protein V8E54_009948 [Elaphomyces granulatus]